MAAKKKVSRKATEEESRELEKADSTLETRLRRWEDRWYYAPPDWRGMATDAMPLLNWIASPESGAPPKIREEAARLIVRHAIAAIPHPGLAKTKMTS